MWKLLVKHVRQISRQSVRNAGARIVRFADPGKLEFEESVQPRCWMHTTCSSWGWRITGYEKAPIDGVLGKDRQCSVEDTLSRCGRGIQISQPMGGQARRKVFCSDAA